MENKRSGISFLQLLLLLGLVPVAVVAIATMIFSTVEMASEMRDEVYNKLRVASTDLASYYEWDLINEGDVTYEHDYVDSLKDQNIELTVFKGDTRLMTSILKNGSTERNEGTTADATIAQKVLGGSDYEGRGVVIGDEKYYVYYKPLYDANGKVWGMAFSGTPESRVSSALRTMVIKMVIVTIIIVVLIAALIVSLSLKLRRPMAAAAEELKRMADGDMKTEPQLDSPIIEIEEIVVNSYGLNKKLHEIVAELHQTVIDMSTVTSSLSNTATIAGSTSEQVTFAIDEVAQGSTSQAQDTQRAQEHTIVIGSAIEHVSNGSDRLKEEIATMQEVETVATQNMDAVLQSSNITNQAIESIKTCTDQTNESAKNIVTAIQLISDIASQTNLLSLNASIEAARAGEAGKGFAVVASSIQGLAEQSANSVKEIESIIRSLLGDIDKMSAETDNLVEQANVQTEHVKDTKSSFDKLRDAIKATGDNARLISDSVTEINTAKVALIDIINELSAISQENAASSEEVSASTEELNRVVGEMKNAIDELQSISETINTEVSFFRE